VEGLDTDVTRPGIEMGLDALSDCGLVSPGYHGVQKPIAAAICQILVTKT
jgi:hypothetical protein